MIQLPQADVPGLDKPLRTPAIEFVGFPPSDSGDGFEITTMELPDGRVPYEPSSPTIAAQNWLEENWPILGLALGALVILSVVTRR